MLILKQWSSILLILSIRQGVRISQVEFIVIAYMSEESYWVHSTEFKFMLCIILMIESLGWTEFDSKSGHLPGCCWGHLICRCVVASAQRIAGSAPLFRPISEYVVHPAGACSANFLAPWRREIDVECAGIFASMNEPKPPGAFPM